MAWFVEVGMGSHSLFDFPSVMSVMVINLPADCRLVNLLKDNSIKIYGSMKIHSPGQSSAASTTSSILSSEKEARPAEPSKLPAAAA